MLLLDMCMDSGRSTMEQTESFLNENGFDKQRFRKKAISVSLPIIAQNILSATISSTDVLMLERVGQNTMTAVSLASNVTNMLFMFVFGMGAAVTMLCAQYYGKKDYNAIAVVEGIALRISTIISLLFSIAAIGFPNVLMKIFTNDAAIAGEGAAYLRIVGFSYVFWGISEVYLAALKSVERVKICTVLNLIAFVFNIIFNAIFSFGLFGAPKMGAAGVALGTLLARSAEFICCMIVSVRSRDVKLRLSYYFLRNDTLFRDFVRLALPAILNDVIWGLAYVLYSAILGHLDSDAVAAYSVVNVVKNFGTVFCYGLGSATGIVLGNLLGEERFEEAERGASQFVFLTVIAGLVGGIFTLLCTPLAIRMSVRLTSQAISYLKIMLIISSYYIMGTAINTTMITGVFRAGGDSRFGMICDFIDMWIYSLPLAVLNAFVLKLPVMWVFFFLCTDEFVKWPWVFANYRSKKWLKNITRSY